MCYESQPRSNQNNELRLHKPDKVDRNGSKEVTFHHGKKLWRSGANANVARMAGQGAIESGCRGSRVHTCLLLLRRIGMEVDYV